MDFVAQRKHAKNMRALWLDYKLDESDYQEMMNTQKGVCTVCDRDFGEESKRACVDHDHYTGQIRGLLCTQCNTRLGWLEKNIYRLLPYLQQRH